jgi:threonine/homoserine/homoserine lactone efflux protein
MESKEGGSSFMVLLSLLIVTLMVSPSGALSPGPLSTAAVALGIKGNGWKTGLKMAMGHMAVELPYVFALVLFFQSIERVLKGKYGIILNVFAFIFILYFATNLLVEAYRGKYNDRRRGVSQNPFVTGALLTGLNLLFLLWWVTVALHIIRMASELGVMGVLVMYPAHVWMDFAWLSFLAETGSRSAKITGSKGYRVLLALLGLLLLFYGIDILVKSVL